MENWLQTRTLKRKKCDHVLQVGSANSEQVVSKYDINISGVKEISNGSCSKKKYF